MVATIIIVIVLVIIIGVVLVVVAGVKKSKNLTEDPLAERLAEYSQRGESVSLEQIELAQPFSERVIMPFMRRLGEVSTRLYTSECFGADSQEIGTGGKSRPDGCIHLHDIAFCGSRISGRLDLRDFSVLAYFHTANQDIANSGLYCAGIFPSGSID